MNGEGNKNVFKSFPFFGDLCFRISLAEFEVKVKIYISPVYHGAMGNYFFADNWKRLV